MLKKEQRKCHLTIAEKGWIVQHAEKNPLLSDRRLAVDFIVKFDRLIYRGTINRILKQNKKIRQISLQASGDFLSLPFLFHNSNREKKTSRV